MRLGEIKRVTTRPAISTPQQAAPEPTEQPAPGRALIALTPIAETHEPASAYRQAPFLAQLLAMRDQRRMVGAGIPGVPRSREELERCRVSGREAVSASVRG